MLSGGDPVSVFITILGVLITLGVVISIHEASHAFVADKLGDPTAKLLGRVTLNPIAHIDTLGTVVFPFILLILGLPVFGWAKPTPINPINFRHPFRDSAITAFAGPASNIVIAILISLLYRAFPFSLLEILITLNIYLAVFNLMPIPPLDGYKVLLGFLPKNLALQLSAIEQYGIAFTFVLLFGFLWFFSPIISFITRGVLTVLIG
jgi:Zn-dependent protease